MFGGVYDLSKIRDVLGPTDPAKAPWYFMGLQELLEHMHPLVAGIFIPTILVVFLIALLSSVGLPGLNGFIGEFTILQGAFAKSFQKKRGVFGEMQHHPALIRSYLLPFC